VSEDRDRFFMRMALREARKGLGRTSPNPCVGAVVVKDDHVIAKGYHKMAGAPHAEINALRKAGKEAFDATIYVTLEPCNHTGRTPPCSHALIAAGIKRVVVGMEDPNPLVNGSGLAYLISRKIEVHSGVLTEECREINRPFLKYITTSTPWVVMKAGISLDGRINYKKGTSGWITGPESLRKAHQLRDISDAIMVGVDTICIDDPLLTTRLAHRKGKDPVRVVVDSNLRIPSSARVLHLDSSSSTWIFCSTDADSRKKEDLNTIGAKVWPVDKDDTGRVDIGQVLAVLGREGITSVLVEGGAKVHGSMLSNRLVDHVNLFYAPLFAGDNGIPVAQGVSASDRNNAIFLKKINYKRVGDDLMVEGDVSYLNR
jgi:diaminohydroxyphosphoribosylaminopyrimidine deaminase / 5-amino-6-(5-phosphoribosylamino)uracil reductase